MLEGIKKLKVELTEIDRILVEQKTPGSERFNFDDMERTFRENLKQIPEAFNQANVSKAREALATQIEKIDVWPDERARLYPAPNSLVALGLESDYIPTRI